MKNKQKFNHILINTNLKSLITLIKPSEKWRPLKDEDLLLVREANEKRTNERIYDKQNEAFVTF